MNPEILDYVCSLYNRMKENNSLFVIYEVYGRKLSKIGSSNSKRDSNKILATYLEEYEVDEGDTFLIVSYGFNFKSFLHGPMIMGCKIIPVRATGKIIKSQIKLSAIHYLPKELKTRGFKIGDYRRLYNGLKSGIIESGIKKWYSAKHLD
mgnify:CR=1 FL=1|jgi:hypothetical protein